MQTRIYSVISEKRPEEIMRVVRADLLKKGVDYAAQNQLEELPGGTYRKSWFSDPRSTLIISADPEYFTSITKSIDTVVTAISDIRTVDKVRWGILTTIASEGAVQDYIDSVKKEIAPLEGRAGKQLAYGGQWQVKVAVDSDIPRVLDLRERLTSASMGRFLGLKIAEENLEYYALRER